MAQYENLTGWEKLSLGKQLDKWAVQYGDRIAVADREKEITYLELNQKAICIGQYFMEKGICKGDKVLVQLPNRISFVAILFALAKIGAVPIMMLPAHREAELEGIIELAKPTAYIVVERYLGFAYVEMAMAMQKKFPCIRNVFVDGAQREEWYEAEMEGQGEFPNVDSYSPAVLLLSGGTTGIPKLIPRTHTDYQSYRVVDEYGRDCPYWAEGELWIGGYGIAKGYRGDSALTNQKFFSDSFGRWYKTGDLGRFWQDGTIEFLGRKDHQVKIRGHRIELGEIEHVLKLEQAWHQVIAKHDMLRAIVSKDGMQQILEKVLLPRLDVYDEDSLEEVRSDMEKLNFDIEKGPNHILKITKMKQGYIIHFAIDMLIADFVSINIILNDLFKAYKLGFLEINPKEVNFRDIVMDRIEKKEKIKSTTKYLKGKEYWLNKIDKMPDRPLLPIIQSKDENEDASFKRYEFEIAKNIWDGILFR